MNGSAEWFNLMNLVLPGLISIIVKPNWPNWSKYATAFCLSFIAAFVQVIYEAQGVGDFPQILLKTFLLVMGSYAAFWRPTGAAGKIESKING